MNLRNKIAGAGYNCFYREAYNLKLHQTVTPRNPSAIIDELLCEGINKINWAQFIILDE